MDKASPIDIELCVIRLLCINSSPWQSCTMSGEAYKPQLVDSLGPMGPYGPYGALRGPTPWGPIGPLGPALPSRFGSFSTTGSVCVLQRTPDDAPADWRHAPVAAVHKAAGVDEGINVNAVHTAQ